MIDFQRLLFGALGQRCQVEEQYSPVAKNETSEHASDEDSDPLRMPDNCSVFIDLIECSRYSEKSGRMQRFWID